VTRDGNDAAATASAGATPFRSIQAAIDFAGSAPNVPVKVCVAGFDTCASETAYEAPRMRDGVSVYGRYASADWTRCSTRTTELTATSSANVRFGSDVTHETVLDGFKVRPSTSSAPATAIVVDGAKNVVLGDIELFGGAPIGIAVSNGAEARMVASSVRFFAQSVGVQVTGGRAHIGQSAITGPGLASGTTPAYAVVLDTAAGSHIVASTLSSTGGSDVAALRIVGNATGIEIRGSTLSATDGGTSTAAVSIASCGGASPVLAGNPSITASATLAGGVEAIRSLGDCHPRIENNPLVRSISVTSVNAVRCGTADGQASACVLTGNTVSSELRATMPGVIASARGVVCEDGACSRLADNVIHGLTGVVCGRTCALSGTGVELGSSQTLVERNQITGGCMAGGSLRGLSIDGNGSRVQNNRIRGTSGLCSALNRAGTAYGLDISGTADVHSNTIDGGPFVLEATMAGVRLRGGGATFRNNIILFGFREDGGLANPTAFLNNFVGAYLNDGTTWLNSAAEINALTDTISSGNIDQSPAFVDGDLHLSSSSPCIDAGTPSGAPLDDMDRETRDASPDIGADEWSAAHDACFGVCANGVCDGSTSPATCTCAGGYQHPAGEPLVCEDVNECLTDNGSCDPLTTCTNTPGGRTCGACPPGHSGNGEIGCTLINYCNTNRCQHGAACVEASGGYACDCPPGITGHDCTIVFDELAAGPGSTCGRHPDGTLSCWGTNQNAEALPPPGTFVTLSRGSSFTCAIRSDGTLACWGLNDAGQTTPPSGTFQAVSAGAFHACAIRTDGTLACWGYGGDGRTTPPPGTFQVVSAGDRTSCAIASDGVLACWGNNNFGQTVPPAGSYQSVTAGFTTSCAISTAGAATCWGLSSGTPPPGPFHSVVAGIGYACALRPSGDASCWGGSVPAPPSGPFDALTGSQTHVCGLRSDRSVACWGQDAGGQASPPGPIARALGGARNEVCTVTATRDIACLGQSFPPPSGPYVDVALNASFACGLRTNGTVGCWGGTNPSAPSGTFKGLASSPGALCALATNGSVSCFGPNPPFSGPTLALESISVASARACGIATTGAVQCWGSDPPAFAGTYRSVGVGPSHVCAVTTQGAVECLGDDSYGQSTPPPGDFVEVVVAEKHSCARAANGAVTCWGDDSLGGASPPQGAFAALSSGFSHTCGLRPDLSVACWGSFVR
jgi:hypothetical protein